MPRQYRHIKQYEAEIFQMKNEGKTNREIAEYLGFERKQVKWLISRHNQNKQKEATGNVLRKPRGRKPAVTIQEYKYENKRLKMENELLRDFLHLAGRK